jgi:uncharacterized protein with GYD domain
MTVRFVMLGTYSEKGLRQIEARRRFTREQSQMNGLEVVSLVFTTGPYDFIEIFDVPSEAAAIAQVTAFKQGGWGDILLVRAYDRETIDDAYGRLPKMD